MIYSETSTDYQHVFRDLKKHEMMNKENSSDRHCHVIHADAIPKIDFT